MAYALLDRLGSGQVPCRRQAGFSKWRFFALFMLCCIVALIAYPEVGIGKPLFPHYNTSEPSSLWLIEHVVVGDLAPNIERFLALLHLTYGVGKQWGHRRSHGVVSGRPHYAIFALSSIRGLFESSRKLPIQVANRRFAPEYCLPGRGLPEVFHLQMNCRHVTLKGYSAARDLDVGSQLPFGYSFLAFHQSTGRPPQESGHGAEEHGEYSNSQRAKRDPKLVMPFKETDEGFQPSFIAAILFLFLGHILGFVLVGCGYYHRMFAWIGVGAFMLWLGTVFAIMWAAVWL
jgi:hypothetical protein